MHVFLGLSFATMAFGSVLFEPRSRGGGLMLLAGTAFGAAAIVTGIMRFLLWLFRRGRTAHLTSPR